MRANKVFGLIVATGSALFTISGARAETPQHIKVVAKRYEFLPAKIELKKNVPVILELTTEDRLHGINIPALKTRSNIPVGKVTELELKPTQSGTFDFYCDVFCGSGHEDMGGKIVVSD